MSQKLSIMVDFLIALRTQNETHHKTIKQEKLFWKEILDTQFQNYKTGYFGNVRICLSAKIYFSKSNRFGQSISVSEQLHFSILYLFSGQQEYSSDSKNMRLIHLYLHSYFRVSNS